jgi:hypothetical protein
VGTEFSHVWCLAGSAAQRTSLVQPAGPRLVRGSDSLPRGQSPSGRVITRSVRGASTNGSRIHATVHSGVPEPRFIAAGGVIAQVCSAAVAVQSREVALLNRLANQWRPTDAETRGSTEFETRHCCCRYDCRRRVSGARTGAGASTRQSNAATCSRARIHGPRGGTTF